MYVGDWKDGKQHGQGTFTLTDGEKYVGESRDIERWDGTEYKKDGLAPYVDLESSSAHLLL